MVPLMSFENESEEKLLQERAEIQDKLGRLEEDRSRLIEEIRRLKSERSGYINEIRELREELKRIRSAKNTLRERLNEIKRKKEETRNNIKKTLDRLLELRSSLPELRELSKVSISAIRDKIDKLEWKIMTGQVDVEYERFVIREIASLENLLERITMARKTSTELNELRAQLISYKMELSDLYKASDEIYRALNEARINEENIKNKINQYSQIIGSIDEKIRKLVEELENIKKTISGLREKLREINRELKRIREERIRSREREVLSTLRRRAEDKLRRGEKLSFEEVFALYGEAVDEQS